MMSVEGSEINLTLEHKMQMLQQLQARVEGREAAVAAGQEAAANRSQTPPSQRSAAGQR